MVEISTLMFWGQMKLMGMPKLFAAAASISLAARGACAALCAELEEGQWACSNEVSVSYPHARWSKGRAFIPVDDGLDAVVAFNFERGIALIDTAKSSENLTSDAATGRLRSS